MTKALFETTTATAESKLLSRQISKDYLKLVIINIICQYMIRSMAQLVQHLLFFSSIWSQKTQWCDRDCRWRWIRNLSTPRLIVKKWQPRLSHLTLPKSRSICFPAITSRETPWPSPRLARDLWPSTSTPPVPGSPSGRRAAPLLSSPSRLKGYTY